MSSGKIRMVVDEGSNPDEDETHFVVYFDRPGRVEVVAEPGATVVAFVYAGAKDDVDQEPLGSYDGALPHNNSWEA